MHALSAKILRFILEHSLLRADDEVVVGLSGGPDSVALALVLEELSLAGALPLRIRLGHLNHCLRGEESDREERFCCRFAEQHSLPIEVSRANVKEAAARDGRSLEDAARSIRYEFLAAVAARHGLTTIATAHHADDVAESVLLRIIRGCGVHGLAALRPMRRMSAAGTELSLIRPLLETRKQELLDYLAERGQHFCQDSSNADTGLLRNRVRHELIPVLESRYQGFSVLSLCALNKAAAEVRDLLDKLIERKWPRLCVEEAPGAVALDAAEFAALEAAEQKAVLRRAAEIVCCQEPLALAAGHYDEVAGLARAEVGAQVSLPGGLAARREHGVVLIRHGRHTASIAPRNLPAPGSALIPEAGLTLHCEEWDGSNFGPDEALKCSSGREVFVCCDSLKFPLAVRGRLPGDRFHPLGATGSRKLKEFFIDRKIPRYRRGRVPLVVAGDGRIVWVVGETIGDQFKLTRRGGRILRLWAV